MELNVSFLNRQRNLADRKTDELVSNTFNNHRQTDLYSILGLSENDIISKKKHSDLTAFLTSKRTLPSWFSEERILKGQEVFAEYASEIMTLLGVLALPFCYAGSPGNKALYFSEKMRNSPGKRLADTAEFIISVSTPGNLTSSSKGIFHINKTRLIHAIARYYLWLQGKWQSAWGNPINQEDMAGTNLAFSYIVLNGLRQSGFNLTEDQVENFIYLWRYVGYQMGINEELLPATYSEAFGLKQKIVQRNFKISQEGIVLTSELLRYYQRLVPATQSQFIHSQVRYYLGNTIADCLGIEKDLLRDGITTYVNSFKKLHNHFALHQHTYRHMIINHKKMKSMLIDKG